MHFLPKHSRLLIVAGILLVPLSQLFAGEPPLNVACMGDSITAGAKVNSAKESYPAQLQSILGPAAFTVKNFGIGGATMIRRGKPTAFQELAPITAFQPDIVIVNFGINDTRSRDADYWSHFDEFPGDTRTVLTQLLDLKNRPAVILCLPTANMADLPGMPDDRKQNVAERLPRLVEVRQKLRDLAKEFSNRNVKLVDLEAVTKDHPELYNVDGVHLNAAGYKLLAETLAPYVRSSTSQPLSQSTTAQPIQPVVPASSGAAAPAPAKP